LAVNTPLHEAPEENDDRNLDPLITFSRFWLLPHLDCPLQESVVLKANRLEGGGLRPGGLS
jgi:hypothetical protein